MRIKKFIPCDLCKDNEVPGYIITKDSDGEEKTYRCSCWVEYQKYISLSYKLERANIPSSIIGYTLDQYKGEDKDENLKAINNYITRFNRFKGFHLYFYGPVGTQKSTLLRHIGKELIKKKKGVYYTLADDMIKELINADRDEELKDKWNKILTTTDLLIIDEMSEDKITTYKSGWQRKFILPFLKKRLEIYEKNVIFSSNSPVDDIGDFFEGAIQDLIKREVRAQLTFTDNYRELSDSFDISKLWED